MTTERPKAGRAGPSAALARGKNDLILFVGIVAGVYFLWDTMLVYPLKVLVVMLHEISHGLMAVLTGGRIVSIEVNANQGGVCWTQGGSRFLTLSAGYLGSMAIGAAILITAARTEHADRGLAAGLGAFLVAITLLYVPFANLFGFAFGVGAGLALIGMAAKLPNAVSDVALKVIGTTSCLYAIVDIKSDVLDRPHLRSDAVMLGELTGIPGVVWGVIWIALAIAVTTVVFLKVTRSAPGAARGRAS